MLLKIIEDIKNSNKVSPNQLYVDLLKERLHKALLSYYHDIDMVAQTFLLNDKNILSNVKKVIR